MVSAKAEGNGGESDILENGVETQGDRADSQGPQALLCRYPHK